MLSDSILGKIDRVWGQSACFKLCSAVLSFFSNAWSSSFLRNVLYKLAGLGRPDNGTRGNGGRTNVLAAGASNAFSAAAENAASGAYDSSAFVRAASGSVFFRPGRVSGLVFLVMFCVPHSAWRNWYALAAAAVLFVSVLILSAAGKRPYMTAADLGRPIVVFGICCVISLLCSEAVYDSVRVLAFFASAFMFMWSAAAGIGDRNALREYLAWIYAAVMIVSLLGMAQKIAGISVNASQTDLALNPGIGRVYSSLENPNNLAEFLVLFSPLCAVFAASGRTPMRRLVLAIGLVLPVTALLLTYSRSGWLSAALTAVLFVYFTKRRILPLIMVLAILAVPLLPSGVLLRLSNMFNPADTSADYRLRIWETTIRLLADQRRFITGIGPGTATLAAQIEFFADEYVLSGIVHSQMLYLELIVEFGLLGAVCALLAFAVPTVRAAFVLKRSDAASLPARVLAACVSSMAGMALFGLFEYTWFYPRILFGLFLLLGIMKAATRMAQAEAAAADNNAQPVGNGVQAGPDAADDEPQVLKRGILVSEAQQ